MRRRLQGYLNIGSMAGASKLDSINARSKAAETLTAPYLTRELMRQCSMKLSQKSSAFVFVKRGTMTMPIRFV